MNLYTYKKLLTEFVSFKSISTDPEFKPEIEKTVEWLRNLFTENGFTVKVLHGKKTNPVVYSHYQTDDNAETVLIYGHYDVQPASIEEGWEQDPFTVLEKKDKWIARGVVDNKGQILIHIATILDLIKANKLKYNVKFLIEGNEENSNDELSEIMRTEKELIKTDHVLISDGEIVDGKPAIEASLRGGFNLTVALKTADNNLHSGIYGGAVPNAAYELSKLLSKLFTEKNTVSFKEFYNGVDPIHDHHRKHTQRIAHTADKLLKHAGIKKLMTEPEEDFYSQTGLRPTLQITGIKAGYIGNGYANIIPATAEARINFRLVASQNPNEVIKAFTNFVEKNIPDQVEYTITTNGIHNPIKIDIDSEISQQAQGALKKAYGEEPIIKFVGGAIPFVVDVKEVFGINSILVPLCNDDCNMHGANENFTLDLIEKGLKFSQLFFSK